MSLLDDFRPAVRRSLPAFAAQRWLTNVGVRIMFTFLPAFARGTGLSIEEMGRVLTMRDLTGLGAPAVGRLADRKGAGWVMLIAGTVASVGVLMSVFSLVGLIVGMALMGIGKVGFDVALNAWVGHEVAYDRRGRAFGLLELTWAAAALIGMPLSGLLIDHVAWWSVPVILGVLGLLVQLRIRQVVDRTAHLRGEESTKTQLTARILAAMFGFGSLTLASQLLFVSHGVWLDGSHGLNPSTIGSVVVIFGVIEAIGTLATSVVADRLGKKNSILWGAGLLLIGTGGLAVAHEPSLAIGLALLAMGFLGFEFSFVSSLPLIAELDPKARAHTMGLFLGFSTLTRALGSLIGTMIYVRGGFDAVMAVASGATVVGVLLVSLFVSEPSPDNDLIAA